MAADKPLELRLDPVVEKLVPDPSQVPVLRQLAGFIGKGSTDEAIRVYAWDFSRYTEVARDAVLYAQPLPNKDSGSIIFVKGDAQMMQNAVQNSFLQGQLTQAYYPAAYGTVPMMTAGDYQKIPTIPVTACPTAALTIPLVCCPLTANQYVAAQAPAAVGYGTIPTIPATSCFSAALTIPLVCCPLTADQTHVAFQQPVAAPTLPLMCPPTLPMTCPPTMPMTCPPTMPFWCPNNQANAAVQQPVAVQAGVQTIPTVPLVKCPTIPLITC